MTPSGAVHVASLPNYILREPNHKTSQLLLVLGSGEGSSSFLSAL